MNATGSVMLDGRRGEGGGQILRTGLTLAAVTGRPLTVTHIRAGRPRPGLLRQHRTAVLAAAAVCSARVEGAELGSQQIEFAPGALVGGDHAFAIGTAGSTALVLQTILPILLRAREPSQVRISGGTHNPAAPPFEFLQRAFLPQLHRMGLRVDLELVRTGFAPAGGGEILARIEPAAPGPPLHLTERGAFVGRETCITLAGLPAGVGEREASALQEALGWPRSELRIVRPENARGPGNVVGITLQHEHLTEVFTAFGRKGVPAEAVGAEVAARVRRYLASSAPVGEHLADQLLLPMALQAGGTFRTLPLSPHTTTNIEVLQAFLGDVIEGVAHPDGTHLVRIKGDSARLQSRPG